MLQEVKNYFHTNEKGVLERTALLKENIPNRQNRPVLNELELSFIVDKTNHFLEKNIEYKYDSEKEDLLGIIKKKLIKIENDKTEENMKLLNRVSFLEDQIKIIQYNYRYRHRAAVIFKHPSENTTASNVPIPANNNGNSKSENLNQIGDTILKNKTINYGKGHLDPTFSQNIKIDSGKHNVINEITPLKDQLPKEVKLKIESPCNREIRINNSLENSLDSCQVVSKNKLDEHQMLIKAQIHNNKPRLNFNSCLSNIQDLNRLPISVLEDKLLVDLLRGNLKKDSTETSFDDTSINLNNSGNLQPQVKNYESKHVNNVEISPELNILQTNLVNSPTEIIDMGDTQNIFNDLLKSKPEKQNDSEEFKIGNVQNTPINFENDEENFENKPPNDLSNLTPMISPKPDSSGGLRLNADLVKHTMVIHYFIILLLIIFLFI